MLSDELAEFCPCNFASLPSLPPTPNVIHFCHGMSSPETLLPGGVVAANCTRVARRRRRRHFSLLIHVELGHEFDVRSIV